MKNWLIFSLTVIGISAHLGISGISAQVAQEQKPWTHNLEGSINLAQVGVKDWAQGDDSSLSWTFDLDGESVYDRPRIDWEGVYSFTFGQSKLADQAVRKTDDKIDFETQLSYKLRPKVGPYLSGSLKTQFADGFEFDENGDKEAISSFFDPAYLTQSAGVIYKPVPLVKIRLGVALREVVTRNFNDFADDSVTEAVEEIRVDGGMESVISVKWKPRENLSLRTKLEVFSAFQNFTDAIVRSDSAATFRLNEYINVKLKMLIVNDTTASPKVQIKEAVTLGLNYTFF